MGCLSKRVFLNISKCEAGVELKALLLTFHIVLGIKDLQAAYSLHRFSDEWRHVLVRPQFASQTSLPLCQIAPSRAFLPLRR